MGVLEVILLEVGRVLDLVGSLHSGARTQPRVLRRGIHHGSRVRDLFSSRLKLLVLDLEGRSVLELLLSEGRIEALGLVWVLELVGLFLALLHGLLVVELVGTGLNIMALIGVLEIRVSILR